jgi:hypothetical protein
MNKYYIHVQLKQICQIKINIIIHIVFKIVIVTLHHILKDSILNKINHILKEIMEKDKKDKKLYI